MAKLRVYVAGPYTSGDVAVNVAFAIEWGNWLLAAGFAPYVPHLTHFWHFHSPHAYEVWMNLDAEWLPCCDAILRIKGDSVGADKETGMARELGIPVFYDDDPDALLAWARVQREIEASVQRRALQR